MLRPDHPLTTDRLLLHPFEDRDLDDVHDYRALPEVARYLYDEPLNRIETAEKLAKWSQMRPAQRAVVAADGTPRLP